MSANLKHISWTESGYWIRFYQGTRSSYLNTTKLIYSEIIHFKDYPDFKLCLKAAIKVRDMKVIELGKDKPPPNQGQHIKGRYYRKNRPSLSGIIGVGLRISKSTGNGSYYSRWVEDGEENRCTFPFKGTSQELIDIAFNKAIKHRAAQIKRLKLKQINER